MIGEDVLWCEDCSFYKSYGTDGEGDCLKGCPDIFYASPICEDFLLKKEFVSNE